MGSFDGVNKGNRFLLCNVIRIAKDNNLKSAIVTFRTRVREIIESSVNIRLLSTLDEKTDRLCSLDIDYCFVLDFNPELQSLSSSQFMSNILSEKLNTKILLIGYDHRFGSDKDKSFDDYKSYGKEIGIDVINSDCYSPDGINISSSSLRRALLKGEVKTANEMLGVFYNIRGRVVKGNMIGRTIGFPTANLLPDSKNKVIPLTGVYSVIVDLDNKRYPGMLNIGHRPTVTDTGNMTIEVHLIGFNGNLYDKSLNIEFIDFIRDEKKFSSLHDLQQQLQFDQQKSLELLTKEGFDF